MDYSEKIAFNKKKEELFAWLIFYKDNKLVKEYQKCQEQINEHLNSNNKK